MERQNEREKMRRRKEKKKKNEKRVIESGTKILKIDKQGKVEA